MKFLHLFFLNRKKVDFIRWTNIPQYFMDFVINHTTLFLKEFKLHSWPELNSHRICCLQLRSIRVYVLNSFAYLQKNLSKNKQANKIIILSSTLITFLPSLKRFVSIIQRNQYSTFLFNYMSEWKHDSSENLRSLFDIKMFFSLQEIIFSFVIAKWSTNYSFKYLAKSLSYV